MKKILLLLVAIVFALGLNAQEVFNQDFETLDSGAVVNADGWVTYSVIGDLGWHVYIYDDNHFYKMSGYDEGATEQEDWFITPAIDLTDGTTAHLSFSTSTKFDGPQLQLMASTDYTGSGDPSSATWTELSGLNIGPQDYSWVQSNIDLSSYSGQTVYVGYKYTSNTIDGSAVFQIDSIVASKAASVNSVETPVISLYPNPTVDMIHFNVNSPNNNVQILNNLGQVVLSAQNVKNTVNVASLPQGVYSVIIENENGRTVKKFVKK